MGNNRIVLHTDKDTIKVLQKHSGHHFKGIADDRRLYFDLLCDCGQLVIAIYERPDEEPEEPEEQEEQDEVE